MIAHALERVNAVGVGVHCALRVQVRDDAGDDLLAGGFVGEGQRVVDVRNVMQDLHRVRSDGNVVADADVHLWAEVPAATRHSENRASFAPKASTARYLV